MMPTTRVTIEHHPRFVRVTVESPGAEVLLRIEALPSVAYRALAHYFSLRAES
jgi:hypothetical protein